MCIKLMAALTHALEKMNVSRKSTQQPQLQLQQQKQPPRHRLNFQPIATTKRSLRQSPSLECSPSTSVTVPSVQLSRLSDARLARCSIACSLAPSTFLSAHIILASLPPRRPQRLRLQSTTLNNQYETNEYSSIVMRHHLSMSCSGYDRTSVCLSLSLSLSHSPTHT